MKHLILAGACYLDTILSVPYYPGEDAKLRARSLTIRRGGNCPNSAEVLQQLVDERNAMRLYLVSSLPHESSPATRRIIESFGQEPLVSFEHSLYREAHSEPASCYVIRSEATGSRTIVNYNELPDMTIAEFANILRSFTPDQDIWCHFESRIPPITRDCIHLLRTKLPAAKISVEIEKPGREGLRDLAAEADVVFYSRSWAEGQGYASPEDCLTGEQRKQGSMAFCTWGADGAAATTPVEDVFRYPTNGTAPVVPVVECVDDLSLFPICDGPWRLQHRFLTFAYRTLANAGVSILSAVGAGDTFIAGMLYGLFYHAQDWDVRRKLSFAVDLATAKVQREGFRDLVVHGLGVGCGS